MCDEPSISLLDAVGNPVNLLTGAASAATGATKDALVTRVGRPVVVALAAGGALYALTQIQVTVPAAVVVGLAACALASTFAAVVLWRRSRGKAPVMRRIVFPQGRTLPAVAAARYRVVTEAKAPTVVAIEEARPQFDEVAVLARQYVGTGARAESREVIRVSR